MITSVNNPKVKQLIQLKNRARSRREEDAFVVEGIRMFRELPAGIVKEVYVTEEFLEKYKNLEQLKHFKYEVVTAEVFSRLSDTVTPQGVLAVVKCLHYQKEALFCKANPCLLLLEDIQDPGNLGTMFRTAEAAGVDGIVMSSQTVDVYNPKVVRSTMGSIFRVPFLIVPNMVEMVQELKQTGTTVYAAALKENAMIYTDADYAKNCAILIGNEGNGLKKETMLQADQCVIIPMNGAVESLNASISAAVLLYETARQRAAEHK